MKVYLQLLVIILMFVLTACITPTYSRNATEGKFISTNTFKCDNGYYSGMKLEVVEITKDEYDNAEFINVIEDFSTSSTDRKYYAFHFSLETAEGEYENTQMRFIEKTGPGGGRDAYTISLMLFDGEINQEYICTLWFMSGSAEYKIVGKEAVDNPGGPYYPLSAILVEENS